MNKEDVVHIHMEYFSVIKKNELCHRSTMDGPRGYHTQCSKPDKDQYHVTHYVWKVKKKKGTNELLYKRETDSQISENKFMVTKGER